ncbi:MAG: Hsp20 family protein [Patescibacteria group bacterium]
MVIIKIKENTEEVSKAEIRKHFDVTSHKWYFSVVDVIGALTDSSDARNYWKVLKNRLKKNPNDKLRELVTRCNQVKLKAKDGKSYLTDVADSETLIDIIESIPKASVEAFKVLIADIDESGTISPTVNPPAEASKITKPEPALTPQIIEPEEDLTEPQTEAQLLVDAYQTPTTIIIKAFIAGVAPDLLNIHVGSRKIIIQGQRKPEQLQDKYLYKELYWPTFSRSITLPCPVEKDNVKIDEYDGLVTIELRKI